ncbi:MAG TPA: tetratricopeptide repeat protein [Bryobacteraceae bacterium]|jgi:tetratricopeptide (TPR) repeat protein|nr:tetratricopeptide repeat protein [Bryobacteraceae bacterium]
MPATFRRFLFAVPLAALFSTVCLAQTTAFEGDVKGVDGQPLKGAVIHLERTDIKGNYKVKTDKKGHYYYGGLPLGTYKISVEVEGKEMDSVNNVRSKLGDPTELSFDLKQAAARAAAAGGTQAAAEAQDAERGMSASQKKDYEEKLKKQQADMAKNKALNDAFNAGVQAEDAKQWDIAVQQFEKASELDPKQNVVWGRLADSYINLANTKAGAERDAALDKGVAAYQKAIELKPDAPEYHNNYALALAKQKKFADAQAELTKAAQLDPASAGKYYYNLGAVLVNTGQTDQAIEAFKKAIDTDPNYAEAYLQYGITLMGKATLGSDGKMVPVPGTAEAFQKYLQLQPNGKDAETAKQMLASLGQSVDTTYKKTKK